MSVYGFAANTSIYKYHLLHELGSSQADVWLALDTATNTQVALKFLDAVQAPVATRLYEAQVGARFKHANLCEVLYADVVNAPNGTPFVLIAQRYFANGSCNRQLQGPGVLPAKSVQRLLIDVLAAVDYLHENGCQHNDVKPGNILIGDHGQYVLTDYGIAWVNQPAGQSAPAYLPHVAPESLDANGLVAHLPTCQTDQYQIGITAYRLVNGINLVRDEFDKLSRQDFFRRVSLGKTPDRSSFSPWVPKRMRDVIRKSISKDPSRRYSSALEMRRALEHILIPRQWEFDANGEPVCRTANAEYRIEVVGLSGSTFDVLCRKSFGSGKTIRKLAKRCATPKEVVDHRNEIFQWVLENG